MDPQIQLPSNAIFVSGTKTSMLAQLFPAASYYPDIEQKNYGFCFGNFFIIGVEGECPQVSELGSH